MRTLSKQLRLLPLVLLVYNGLTLNVLSGLKVNKDLSDILRSSEFPSLFDNDTKNKWDFTLTYNIFEGVSSFRSLLSSETEDSEFCRQLFKHRFDLSGTACALLLLCRGYGDIAHEAVLGVTPDNFEDAEYAATHPGETSWTKEHPLSDTADMLHSLIHRYCEGDVRGEGNYTGWDNAKYWAAGGPKQKYNGDKKLGDLDDTIHHPVHCALVQYATKHAPTCVRLGVVLKGSQQQNHIIIAGKGNHRTVCVGHINIDGAKKDMIWDPFRFIDLIKYASSSEKEKTSLPVDCDMEVLRQELDRLHQAELCFLLRYELLQTKRKNEIRRIDETIKMNLLLSAPDLY